MLPPPILPQKTDKQTESKQQTDRDGPNRHTDRHSTKCAQAKWPKRGIYPRQTPCVSSACPRAMANRREVSRWRDAPPSTKQGIRPG